MRFPLLLLPAVVVVLVVAWYVGAALRPATQETPTQPPLIFSGVGSRTTERFHLTGGGYRAVWSAWGDRPEWPPCTHSMRLLAVDGSARDLAAGVQVPGSGASDTYTSELESGEYYLDVMSACAWQISITRN